MMNKENNYLMSTSLFLSILFLHTSYPDLDFRFYGDFYVYVNRVF